MTKDKIEKLIRAFTVAGVLLLVTLFLIIGVQLVEINRVKREKANLEQQIAQLEQEVEQGGADLSYYQSSVYLELAARKYGYIFSGDIQE